MTFLWLFLEKGIGTTAQAYKLEEVNQNLSGTGGDGEEVAGRKAALRVQMLGMLRAMPVEERASRSEVICARVAESAMWQQAQRVLLFSPLRSEPDIAPLQRAAVADGKQVAGIPTTLRADTELTLPFTPDFVLVPGLAFSRDGHRLGRGGGVYDRLLSKHLSAAVKVGVCFASQVVEDLPTGAHDVILDGVITD